MYYVTMLTRLVLPSPVFDIDDDGYLRISIFISCSFLGNG